jgi:hypothetical protein
MATLNNVLHHDVLLTQYVQHWTPPKDVLWYTSDLTFPIVPVDKASNVYKVINQQTFMQTAPSVVGPRGDVGTVQAYYDPEGSYRTVPYALDGVIDHLERDEADDVALYEQLQTDLPMVVIRNNMELDSFNVLLNSANLGTNFENVAAGDMFDNYGSLTGNPILYIWAKCHKIMSITGRKVNFVGLDRMAWRSMQFHPAVQQIAPVHTTPAGLQAITVEMLEERLKDVIEKGAIKIMHFRYDRQRGPKATNVIVPRSAIGPNLVIGRMDPTSREDISATKQFAFTGLKDVVNGASLVASDGQGNDVPLTPSQAAAPISAFTYPMFSKGQRGATGVRVLTNRDFRVTRSTSLFVSFGIVDKTNTGLYGTELQ